MLRSGRMPTTGMTIDKARVAIGYESLGDLIETAYSVKAFQIVGPSWLETEMKASETAQHFDIQAKMPEGTAGKQVPEMLRSLLSERFKMTAHREKRELSAYALVIGKNGTKMKPGVETETPPVDGTLTAGMPSGEQMTVRYAGNGSIVSAPGFGTLRQSFASNGSLHMEATSLTMARLADMMPAFVGKPVIDKTGLTGGYQVVIDISAEEMRAALEADGAQVRRAPVTDNSNNVASDPGAGSSWFSVVERLGLKLESRKEPVDVIVIDHIERAPTEN